MEFVLTGRPLMADGTRRLQARLFYQDAPLPDAVVTLFTRLPDGDVATGLVTGSDGMVGVAPCRVMITFWTTSRCGRSIPQRTRTRRCGNPGRR